ncbi:MAG: thermonuclease family protein [candidate division Zixibacteria bacterium]|nr:thermonuclease family protein [candidate division Zixibacteria bacterium]
MKKYKFKSRLFGFSLLFLFGLVLVLFFITVNKLNQGTKVKEVIDGDTIILTSGQRVRYIGIDTPEESQPFYREAKEFNRKMVQGKNVVLEFDVESQDRYGRLLAYVYVNNTLVNAELMKNGLALIYTYPPNVKYANLFLGLQKEAQKKNLGIWSLPLPKPEEYYVGSIKSRRFHRPKCPHAEKITSQNLIRFKTRQEALDLGYSPCRSCQP